MGRRPARTATAREAASGQVQARVSPVVALPWRQQALDACFVFAVALLLRLAHLWALRDSPFFDVLLGDAQSYDAWARQIAGGDWIGHEVFYQAPLYPYFLGAIYTVSRSLLLVRIAQALLGAASCALLGIAAAQWFGRKAGVVAGLLLAVYAPAIFLGALIQKSALDVFFMCLLLALLPKPNAGVPRPFRLWVVGLTLGALSLTRENTLIFVPVVVAWLWMLPGATQAARLRLAAALLVGVAVVLLPVAIRNGLVGGEFHLTTSQTGPNFFIGNNAESDGTYMALRYGHGSPEYERVDATEIASRAAGRALTPGEVSSYWMGRAFEFIRNQPRDWLALEARKFRLLWNATEVVDTESQESHAEVSPVLRATGWFAHFGVLAPLALAGMWLTWAERRRLLLVYLLVVAYGLAVLAFYVVARYRIPLAPLLAVFAAAALVRGPALLRGQPRAHLMAGAAALAAVTVFCNSTAVPSDLMRAVTFHNLGVALETEGRVDEAVAAFRHAVELQPDYAPAHNSLGSALRRQGHVDEAIAELEHALGLRPDFPVASFNLANALAAKGRLPEAIARYEALTQTNDEHNGGADVDVYSNLGVALAEAGRLDEAVDALRRAVALAPETATPHFNLGHALLMRGQASEAVKALSRAVQLAPTDASIRDDLGRALMSDRRFAEAVEQYREVVRLQPQAADAHNNFGMALGAAGRLEEAAAEFQRAIQLDPALREAHANLRETEAVLDAVRRARR